MEFGVAIPPLPAAEQQVVDEALRQRHNDLDTVLERIIDSNKMAAARMKFTWSRVVIRAIFHHVSAAAMLLR